MKMKTSKKATATGLRWMMVSLTMPSVEDLSRGMEITSTFEERHGGKPPLYFARYTEDNTIRISVLTHQDNKSLRRHFRGLGVHKLKITERGGGSWEHCHMFQVAKHLFPKTPEAIMDVIHWLHNMCGYTYMQEVTNYQELSSMFMRYFIKRPNEPIAPVTPLLK